MSLEHPTHPPVLLGDRYRVDELIGSGGMGRVHRAWDTRLGRRVAIKVLGPELAADPDVSARLRAEGRLLAALQHPNLVTLHDIPDDDAVTYLVMELVDGESLADRLRREGPLPAREVSAIITGVAAGLSALHGAGIVHGDVSPANILLGIDGRARLADLGLAHDVGAAAVPAADGLIHGTLRYLAPERLDGSPATPATDVYALAADTYATLVGRPPVVATDVVKLRAALVEPPIRPSLLRPGLAPALDDALLDALGPADGRPDAYHLAVALAHGLRASVDPALSPSATTVVSAPVGITYRTVRGRTALGRGRRSALALTAGVLLLAVGGASLAALDGVLARPGSPTGAPLTARVEPAHGPDADATTPVTVTAAAQQVPASDATQRASAQRSAAQRASVHRAAAERAAALGRSDTPAATTTARVTTGLAAIAGPVATLRAATVADGLTRALASLRAAGTDATSRTETIVAGRPQPVTLTTSARQAPVVRLPQTVATTVALPSTIDITPITLTGGDRTPAAGIAAHTRATVTIHVASSRAAAGRTQGASRPVTTATVVRHEAEHTDRSGKSSGSGRDDREDRGDREDRAVREDGEDHSGKG